MKRLCVLFLSILVALSLTSCQLNISQGRRNYKKFFHKIYKNPASLVVYDETYTVNKDGSVDWVLDVGGENSYGGMVRRTWEINTSESFVEAKSGVEKYTYFLSSGEIYNF